MTPLLSYGTLKLLNVTEVTDCVRVDRDVHVKLFYKGSPLPQWFHHGRDCRLTRKSMIQNFSTYIKLEGEQTEDLKEIQEKKNIVQYYSIFTSSTLHFFTNIPIIN